MTTESDDFDSEVVALSPSMADAMLAADIYAGHPLDWEDETDFTRAGPGGAVIRRVSYSPRVGRLSLRGPYGLPFALPAYRTWEEKRPPLCKSSYGDFTCVEPEGHAGKHRSSPPSSGYFSRPMVEW